MASHNATGHAARARRHGSGVGTAAYHGVMVDPVLMEQVEQLSESDLLELRRAIDAKLDEYVPAAILVEIEQRLTEIGPDPVTDYVTVDKFRRQVRTHPRSA